MKTWTVIIPIAGHAHVTVEAETENDAIEKAFENVTLDHVEEWVSLEQVSRGQFCNFPSPWEVEAICKDGGEDSEP